MPTHYDLAMNMKDQPLDTQDYQDQIRYKFDDQPQKL